MKFAKELEKEAVPEWRIKYLNYKAGKKYVKAVARAINRANATPHTLEPRTPSAFASESLRPTQNNGQSAGRSGTHHGQSATPESHNTFWTPATQPIPTANKVTEGQALTGEGNSLQYGSFVPTPPNASPATQKADKNPFELPAPAMRGPPDSPVMPHRAGAMRGGLARAATERSASMNKLNSPSGPEPASIRDMLLRRPTSGNVGGLSPLRTFLSHASGLGSRDQSKSDVGMRNFDLVREREREFYDFLDSELDKVEAFYKLKEEQAAERLVILREQLHEMRNRRITEMTEPTSRDDQTLQNSSTENSSGLDKSRGWVQPIKAKIFPPGPNSKAFQTMVHTPHMPARNHGDASRDYIRRPRDHDVPYRTAKRKLKLALQEFYRSLELLKSYALLNRTAFRKLNKKYDKAVNARPPFRYMNEKVHKAWFVNSDIIDGQIQAVEDLYARYFERGNHKLAAGKLRSLSKKSTEESGSSFLNGFLIGTGIVFIIQGLIAAVELLNNPDPTLSQQTNYLMQIYGGYFLMLLMMGLFCINCFIWQRNKINYPFIFEFDQRDLIDWRRLAEFPSFFTLMLGIFLWMNFSEYRSKDMFIYYPVFLIGITVIIIFFPGPVLAPKSRKWFAYSHGRLLLAGIYGVEFRDFFLGDIYCSLTYAMANIELFFCLYANHWNNPPQCNSSHSRLLGFLTALPPIWRFLQCIRRYKDTRNVFPHLVNCGKYTMSIMAAVTLSLYRINNSSSNFGLFLAFSIINGIYCSIWDVFMDFSLLQTHSRYFALRDILALKSRWPYYGILVVDPILRFSWIFYAIFTHDRQHSTIVSFLVGLVEVFRRCMWAVFRVENEHCANVSQYKASRDVPLPYQIEPLIERASCETSPMLPSNEQQQQRLQRQRSRPQEQEAGRITGSSTAVPSTPGTMRRRADSASARSFSKLLAEAHKQDFEKKRRPMDEDVPEDVVREGSEDDDEDDDSASLYEVRQAEELRRMGEDN